MITDLQSLRAALVNYINRSDATEDQLNQFIDNGRRQAARFNAREQEQSAMLTLDTDLRAALPDGFKEARACYTVEGINIPQIGSAFAPPDEPGYRVIRTQLQVIGGSAIVAGDQVELLYYEFPPQLVANADTGVFLQANGDLWLWCAAQDAAAYYRNEALQETAEQRVADIGARVASQANKGRQYGGPRVMRVRG
jgi:phospholipase/lecithinase/hemolysin